MKKSRNILLIIKNKMTKLMVTGGRGVDNRGLGEISDGD